MSTAEHGAELTPSEGHSGPFDSSKQIVIADAGKALAALFEAIVSVGRTIGGARFAHLCRLAEDTARAFGVRRDTVGTAFVDRDTAIDLAARLVECADELSRRGCFLEAFAVEGIEGRLIESLLGSGPFANS